MDLYYLCSKIEEELKDAKAYAKKAVSFKPINPPFAKNFYEMSTAEVNHAMTLYKMYEESYSQLAKTYETVPEFLREHREAVIDMYTECTAEAKTVQDLYIK